MGTLLVYAVDTATICLGPGQCNFHDTHPEPIFCVPRSCVLWQSVLTCRVLHKLPQSTGRNFENHCLERLLASPLVQPCPGFVFSPFLYRFLFLSIFMIHDRL